jgi:hypothetical protein
VTFSGDEQHRRAARGVIAGNLLLDGLPAVRRTRDRAERAGWSPARILTLSALFTRIMHSAGPCGGTGRMTMAEVRGWRHARLGTDRARAAAGGQACDRSQPVRWGWAFVSCRGLPTRCLLVPSPWHCAPSR